jgi:RNA-directed DNA polymerase
MKTFSHLYENAISIENLFQAWEKFKKGKRGRRDVLEFERNLEDNLFELHQRLRSGIYQHGPYQHFYVTDPKQRFISKPELKDRVIHHLLFSVLEPIFETTFISDSYSCRTGRGTHKGIGRLRCFARRVSKNHTRNFWYLKADVEKFFDSTDQEILFGIVGKRIKDSDILWLVKQVLGSFSSDRGSGKGLPLGNLTSQLFANIYLNELDRFVKQQLRVRYYLRYADDFLILNEGRGYLKSLLPRISEFLVTRLKLSLHPRKIIVKKFNQGIDFLGYVVLPHHTILRTKTRRRMFERLKEKAGGYRDGRMSLESLDKSLQSYLGLLGHADSYKLGNKLKDRLQYRLLR